jgi:hypothetical protein
MPVPIRQKDGGCTKSKIRGHDSWKPENEVSVSLLQYSSHSRLSASGGNVLIGNPEKQIEYLGACSEVVY